VIWSINVFVLVSNASTTFDQITLSFQIGVRACTIVQTATVWKRLEHHA